MAAVAQKHTRLNEGSVERKAIASYIGLAMGDALGAMVEFMAPAQIKDLAGGNNPQAT